MGISLKDKKTLYITISALLALALIAGAFVWVNREEGPKRELTENENIVLRKDEGIDIRGFAPDREIFARYKLIDTEREREDLGPEGNINISKDNAKVFVTRPDGTQEEVTSERWFVPFQVYPTRSEGTYKFTFELNSGEIYEREVEFTAPKEVDLVKEEDLTRTQEKPTGYDDKAQLPPAEQQLLEDLEMTHEDTRELQAFSLEGVDLENASSAFRIGPRNIPYSSKTPGDNIDEYFWLYLNKIDRFAQGQHMFLAEVDGVWHYAIENYPEDFNNN